MDVNTWKQTKVSLIENILR